MSSNPESYIERIDDFPDFTRRALVTLTAQGQADTETWLPLDVAGDVPQQHIELARRTHRLMKIRIRKFLNSVATSQAHRESILNLVRCITESGFEMERMHFRDVHNLVVGMDLSGLLQACIEEARVAGFITDAEVEQLFRLEAIEVNLDPRPPDVPPGPPLVFQECY